MKKFLNIALTAVLALAFSACDDVDLEKGTPSTTPQQPIIPADGITAIDVVANGGSVNLEPATDGYVDLLDITKLENFPENQELKIVMNVSTSQDMSAARQIDLNVIPAPDGTAIKVAQVSATDLDEAVKAMVTRDPTVQSTLYVNYVAYALDGTTTVLLGSVGTQQSIVITPLSYEHIVESTYYIYGTINGNSIADAVQLSHQGNQYDNPVFQLKVDISSDQLTDGGWKFKVIPASTKQAGQTWEQNHSLTFIGSGEEEGTLAYATTEADCEWIVVDKPGEFMLNINVLDQTWSISNAIPFVYVPGDGNGWSWSTKLSTTNYINYTGFANLKGSFKFTGAAEWNNDKGNYGAGETNYQLQNGSNTNFTVDGTEGLYYLNVNLGNMSYTKTLITSIGIVGSNNDWNAAAPIEMTPSDDNLTWEGEVTLSDSDIFKFCMNHGWDINLGGTEDNLTVGGNNLDSPGAGTYLILLDLSVYPYQCFIEEQ